MKHIRNSAVLAVVLALAAVAPARLAAQRETERFIPIGRSPGVSGAVSVVGEIQAVDTATLSVTVRSAGGPITFQLTSETQIWIDRSEQQLTNLNGSYEDCEVGRTIEVKFIDPQVRARAEWIKVAVGPPS